MVEFWYSRDISTFLKLGPMRYLTTIIEVAERAPACSWGEQAGTANKVHCCWQVQIFCITASYMKLFWVAFLFEEKKSSFMFDIYVFYTCWVLLYFWYPVFFYTCVLYSATGILISWSLPKRFIKFSLILHFQSRTWLCVLPPECIDSAESLSALNYLLHHKSNLGYVTQMRLQWRQLSFLATNHMSLHKINTTCTVVTTIKADSDI